MFFRFNKFTILWAIIILAVTLISGTSDENLELKHTDKIVHFVLFSVLSFLMILGLSKQGTYVKLKYDAIKVSILTTIGYGLLIEIMQFSLAYRNFSTTDLLANTAGAFFGYGMFYVIYKMKFK